MPTTYSQELIREAERYQREVSKSSLLGNSADLPRGLSGELDRMNRRALIFDIETGGLNPKDPIYEMGFQRGIRNPKFEHIFTNPEGREMSSFAEKLLAEREAARPGIMEAIGRSSTPERDGARYALETMGRHQGTDLWVQNLQFESRFISERANKSTFESTIRGFGIESHTRGSTRLYSTDMGIKAAIDEAKRTPRANRGEYLSKWEDVFGEFRRAMGSDPTPGTTRIFDVSDLTKSVYAMAQRRGYMPATGDVFSGTSIDVISQVAYGQKEAHTALLDNVLQGQIMEDLYGAGFEMQAGRDLSPKMQKFFAGIGRAQTATRNVNAKKRVMAAFQGIERYKASAEAGTPDFSLLEPARTDFEMREFDSPISVRQPGGEYAQTKQTIKYRKRFSNELRDASMDMGDLISAWKDRDTREGITSPDYDRAYRDLQREYISPYESKLAEVGGDRAAALSAMQETESSIIEAGKDKIMQSAKRRPVGEAAQQFMRGKWLVAGIAVGAVGALSALWSAADDEYNYIEGMRHSGFSGAKRRIETEFGSGYQGTNPKIRKDLATIDIESYKVEDADTIAAVLAGGDKISVRLAGIDAPETQHDHVMAGRVNQAQAYGAEATEILRNMMQSQSNLKLQVDPTAATTYGRAVGNILGDNNVSLNLELVRHGAANVLPYGKASDRIFDLSEFKQAQQQAMQGQFGMWADQGWRTVQRIKDNVKRGVTNNTFTQIDKLYDNFRNASLSARLNSRNEEMSAMQAVGGKDDFNIIEGLRHGWAGSQRRSNIGDFGSGYVINKVVPKLRTPPKVRARMQKVHRHALTMVRRNMRRENVIRHHIG